MKELDEIELSVKRYIDTIANDKVISSVDIPAVKLIMLNTKMVLENLLSSLLVINTKFIELDQELKVLKHDTQEKFYYKCDRCETLMESYDAYPPDQVCTSENKSSTSGICGGRFSIRLTREQYLDYFLNNAG